MKPPSPPRMVERLLEALDAGARFGEDLLGDLAEEFAERAGRDGLDAARLWYCRESLRSAPHLARDWSRRLGVRDVTRLGGVALASHVLVVTLALLAITAVRAAVAVAQASPGRVVIPSGDSLPLSGLSIGAVAIAVAGGYIAAWLNRRAPLFGAIATGVLWALAAVVATLLSGASPTWYRVVALAVLVLGTTAGGVLRVCTSRPRARGT